MLVFGLDYDKTFTAAPELFRRFIADAERCGHRVVCVTARREPIDFSRDPRLPDSVPVVLAGSDWKRHAAAKAGHNVNIWIDDTPGLIDRPLKLEF